MKIKLFVFFVFSTFFGFSQNLLNIPVSGNSSQVRAVNLKENGIMVLDKASDGVLNIQKIDTALNVVWETQTDIPNKANFIDDYYDGKFLYIILEPKNAKSFVILKISTAFSAYQKFEFPLTNNFQYGYFAANDQVICLGGSVKSEPFIAILETAGGAAPKFISGNAKGTIELQSIDLVDDRILTTFINTQKRTNQIILREYDYNGKVLLNKNIVSENNYKFLSARYFDSGEKRLLVGNYGIGKTPSDGFHSTQGIFVTDADRSKTKYYSFDIFKNLFGFLNDRQKGRLEKQVKKKKDKGSEYSFDYRLFITGLQAKGNQTLIVGEVFQPEFRNRNFSGMYGMYPYSSMYWGRPLMYNYYWMNSPFYGYNYRNSQIFDGFKYLEGVIFSIDDEGNLAWDNSFPYKNLKYYDLASHLKVSNVQDNTMAMYSNSSKLNVSEVNVVGQAVNKREFDPESLDLQFRNKKSEFTNFEHWYGDVYFNWGVQKSGGSNNCFIQRITP
jgi:hypothetical protein